MEAPWRNHPPPPTHRPATMERLPASSPSRRPASSPSRLSVERPGEGDGLADGGEAEDDPAALGGALHDAGLHLDGAGGGEHGAPAGVEVRAAAERGETCSVRPPHGSHGSPAGVEVPRCGSLLPAQTSALALLQEKLSELRRGISGSAAAESPPPPRDLRLRRRGLGLVGGLAVGAGCSVLLGLPMLRPRELKVEGEGEGGDETYQPSPRERRRGYGPERSSLPASLGSLAGRLILHLGSQSESEARRPKQPQLQLGSASHPPGSPANTPWLCSRTRSQSQQARQMGRPRYMIGQAEGRTSQPFHRQSAMLQLHARTAQMMLLLLLLLSAMAGRRAAATAAAPSTVGHESDESALLDFKAKAAPGRHSGASLASWSRNGSYCSWEGVTCGGRRHPRRVVALDLHSRGLAGTISPAIGNLTFLRSLNLSLNALRGDIPPAIGSLRRLRYLDLADNSLTGEIPRNISRCASLEFMAISDNKDLQGRIPAEIGDLPMLRVLRLGKCSITGAIPASLGNLSRLEELSLPMNHIEGPIPEGIGGNPHLSRLQLAMNNLSGALPPSLYNLSSLKLLSVAENEQLNGRLPQDFGTTLGSSMLFFMLGGNQFTGALPESLTNLSNLQIFDVSVNEFSGVVPSALNRLQHLEWFNLDNNMFRAYGEQEWAFLTSLTNCSSLQALQLGWNSRFAGELPNSLANLSTTLQILTIFSNSISGAIPADIGNLVGLQQLTLGENLLTGAIPVSIGKLTQLSKLLLDFNNLSGSIPPSIGNLTGLVELTVKANSLEGPIPASMGNLEKLSVLDLSSNNLSGVIPRELMNLSSLSRYLDLSDNLLEGPLPSEVGNYVNLGVLSLSRNRLSGMIPDDISNCAVLEMLLMDDNLLQGSIPPVLGDMKGLTLLNLTSNKLNGSIPGDLGDITNLQQLYLAHNNLSGQIPQLLGNQTSLVHLDLSFNNLQGEVPQDGVFKNLTGLSIVGNDKLCGGIPQLHLPKCPNSAARNNKKTTSMSLRIALPTVGAILVFLSVLSLAAFLYRRSMAMAATQLEEKIPPRFIDFELPMVSYDEILKGTDGFSESNLLGQGSHGSVYSGTLKNGRVPVAVKVFNLEQSGSYKSFQAECEALRRVRHRGLVKIITCCSSIDHQGKDFRALVFELMPNGNLDSWIHSDSDLESQSRNAAALTFEQRLGIAVDITDALDYLHNGCHPMIIHCDLKPSNILLTQDMRACVGDFGIARILNQAARETCVNPNSTIGVRGSIGYVAPEYGEGLGVSTHGDVYSLGIVLIEMFTGRRPTDDMFRDGLNLHYFAEAALPGQVMEIADSRIWLYDQAENSKDTGDISKTRECLAAIIQLGVLCSKQSPKDRPSIRDAAVEMHKIRDTYLRHGDEVM